MAVRNVAEIDLSNNDTTQVFAANADRITTRIQNSAGSANDIQIYLDQVDDPAADGILIADLGPGQVLEDLTKVGEIGRISAKMVGAGTAKVIGVEYTRYATQS